MHTILDGIQLRKAEKGGNMTCSKKSTLTLWRLLLVVRRGCTGSIRCYCALVAWSLREWSPGNRYGVVVKVYR
jgi:hypothetical protein